MAFICTRSTGEVLQHGIGVSHSVDSRQVKGSAQGHVCSLGPHGTLVLLCALVKCRDPRVKGISTTVSGTEY